jgi:molecular chaperone DnaK
MPDEFKDKISDDDKKAIEGSVKEAEDKLKSDNKEELEEAFKTLSERVQSIGAKLYQEAAKEDSKTEGETKSDDKPDSDQPVEGEVVDKDKK